MAVEADVQVYEMYQGGIATGRWGWHARLPKAGDGVHQVILRDVASTEAEARAAAEAVRANVEAAYAVLTCTDPRRVARALQEVTEQEFPAVGEDGSVAS